MRDLNECYIYIQHITAEHRRLNAMLCEARVTIGRSCDRNRQFSSDDVLQCLGRIRRELQDHFAEEEDGGCLDEAVSRCPRLASTANVIQAEHPALLAELDRLMTQTVECSQKAVAPQAFGSAFKAFYLRLHAHEAAENELLGAGFGSNMTDDTRVQTWLASDDGA